MKQQATAMSLTPDSHCTSAVNVTDYEVQGEQLLI